MKKEYDFSKAERGRFFHPEAKMNIPVYLDQDIESWFAEKAKVWNVEHLGSGVPRIVNAYGKEAFEIRDSYVRIIFRFAETMAPKDNGQSGVESGMALRIFDLLKAQPLSKADIAKALGKEEPTRYLNELMQKLIKNKQVAFTIPEKPNSRLQQYRLTKRGLVTLKNMNEGRSGGL